MRSSWKLESKDSLQLLFKWFQNSNPENVQVKIETTKQNGKLNKKKQNLKRN